MVEVEDSGRFGKQAAALAIFFVSAHLVIILEWKSAHVGRNSSRELKQMHKDHEIT